MRRTLLLLTMVGAALLAFSGVLLAQGAPPDASQDAGPPKTPTGKIPDQYVVVLKDYVGDPGAVAREHAQRHGAEVIHTYQHAIKGYAARIPEARLAAVRDDPRVQFVSEDREVKASAQELPTGVNRIEGDLDTNSTDAGNGNGSVNTNVAVLDTGIYKHTDLNVAGGYNCTSRKTSAWSDGHGHGTHVAGTIGAKDDANGVVGAAPGAKLWAMKVLDNRGSGSTSSVICGIDQVTKHNTDTDPTNDIKVANMSLGGEGRDDENCGNTNDDAYHKAICRSVNKDGAYGPYPGATYVVAAGNDGTNFSGTTPAAYNEVLTVTAVADFDGQPGGGAAATCREDDEDDTSAIFSNFTNTKVENEDEQEHTIAAPGVCIRSTWKGGGYNTISGTSMASPHVAGTAALCIASGKCTGAPADVLSKLRTDAELQPSSYGFKDDPRTDPIVMDNGNTRYYGYLEYAGGY